MHETPKSAELSTECGLIGDRWLDNPKRETGRMLTLMNHTVAELITGDHHPLHMPGDNLLVEVDLSIEAAPVGTQIAIGETLVEITPEPHTGCAKFSARFGTEALKWVNHTAFRARRLRGVNARVIRGGSINVGDAVAIVGRSEVARDE